jgi:hypothetical protein
VPLPPSLPMKTLLHVVCRGMQMMHMMVPRPMEASMPSPQMMRPPQTTMMPQPAEERHQQSDSGGPLDNWLAWTSAGGECGTAVQCIACCLLGLSLFDSRTRVGVHEQSGGVSVLGHI